MNKQLHILFLCGWYPSRVSPTNGDFIQRHAEAVTMKHKVTVLHIITDENLSVKKEIEFAKINNVETYIGYVKKTKNPFLKWKRFISMFSELSSKINAFDVIHVNTLFPLGLFGLYLKLTKKSPYIISEHWTGYHSPRSKNMGIIQKSLSKMIVKNASFVCPVTDNLADSMQQLGFNGNYYKVPNVVDTGVFTPIKNTHKTFTIIHVSSLFDAHKNVSGMLEVAKKLEEKIGYFSWKFIGGTENNFKDQLKKLDFKKAKIEFINHIPQQELVSHLQSASIFVLFSNYENLPCVILEAFSCGVSVIATKVGGIQEFFPNEFGFLIDKKNEQQLLDKIISLYKEPKNQQPIMHQYAIDNFSSEKICDSFTKLYREALN